MKKIADLLNNKAQLRTEIENLISEGKLVEAKAKKEELLKVQDEIELTATLIEDEKNSIVVAENKVNPAPKNTKTSYDKDVFTNILVNRLSNNEIPVNDEYMQFMNEAIVKESDTPNGAELVVPKDISQRIIELRKSLPSLENLVTVEPVNFLSGTRVIELNPLYAPFPPVAEGEIFPDAPKPQFDQIAYKVNKYGDILKLTYELTKDAPILVKYIVNWFAKRGTATRNNLILNALNVAYPTSTAVATLDDLKKMVNVTIPVINALDVAIVTNQDGFHWLDTLKSTDGKYVLQPNPVDATEMRLFGKYKVSVFPNEILKTETGKAPIFVGDLKAITLFDREKATIDFNDKGDGYWNRDLIAMKGRERLDVKVIDKTAIVKGEITVTGV